VSIFPCSKIHRSSNKIAIVKESLPQKTFEWLKGIHDRGELLKPEQPARLFVQFAVNGIPDDMVSTIVEWNDPRIKHE
jgi:hypothetical protein